MKVHVDNEIFISEENIIDALKSIPSSKQMHIIKMMAKWGDAIDVAFIEGVMSMMAKMYLIRKKDRAFYNRNRAYFNALKIISKANIK